MHRFARLIETLDSSAQPEVHRAALVRYFRGATAEDAAWALHLLRGGRLRTGVSALRLRTLACEVAGIDPWLFDACRQVSGDLAETIAHLLPPPAQRDHPGGLADWIQHVLLLRDMPSPQRDASIAQAWAMLDTTGRQLFTQLAAGGPRLRPDPRCLLQSLAEHAQLDARLLALRLQGWLGARSLPDARHWRALVAPDDGACVGLPFSFQPVAELAGPCENLGAPGDWLVQWQFDGLQAQIVKRQGQVWIWSADEELVTASLPDVAALAHELPDGTVLEGLVTPGHARQRGAQPPVRFILRDLLEDRGMDLRGLPLQERLVHLQAQPWCRSGAGFGWSPALTVPSWTEGERLRQGACGHAALGLLLRSRAGVRDGDQPAQTAAWVCKREPSRLAAILVYVHVGVAGVHPSVCGFAVWSRQPADAGEVQAVLDAVERGEAPRAGDLELVTVAKLDPGPTVAQGLDLRRLIQASQLRRVGPVRVLRPTRVVELAFDGVRASPRHKCGFVLLGARVVKGPVHDALQAAGWLEQLRALC